jgi:ribose 5-phosphate isomerase B
MRIYLGADHRGFELKEKVKKYLTDRGYEYTDLGATALDLKDDYTLYAGQVGSVVAKDATSRGILLCGSGIGVDVVANKFDGVRAGMGKSAEQVKAGRNDDNMNVLVLASDFTTSSEAYGMIKVFLETGFEGAERFKKRLSDIEEIEKNN